MAALAACAHLAAKGHTPVMHLNCRDYNRIALTSLALGAASLNVLALIVTPGIHQTRGRVPEAKNVHDLDPLQAIAMLDRLRKEGALEPDLQLEGEVHYLLGAVENPLRGPQVLKPHLLQKKIRCGVDFLITTPIDDYDALEAWRTAVNQVEGIERLPILIGLGPEAPEPPETIRSSGRYAGVYRHAA